MVPRAQSGPKRLSGRIRANTWAWGILCASSIGIMVHFNMDITGLVLFLFLFLVLFFFVKKPYFPFSARRLSPLSHTFWHVLAILALLLFSAFRLRESAFLFIYFRARSLFLFFCYHLCPELTLICFPALLHYISPPSTIIRHLLFCFVFRASF
ncbi:hypothetical protein BDZ91DRAFT_457699 [Kalaharituber pfeilii]|nr:hypothetical protein BDZ91DRAFT_457699 [Kalaharituber pfeilii]